MHFQSLEKQGVMFSLLTDKMYHFRNLSSVANLRRATTVAEVTAHAGIVIW